MCLHDGRSLLKRCALFLLFAPIWFAGCHGEKTLVSPASDGEVHLQMGGVEVVLETALTDPERTRGMMYREELAPNRGMLFLYPEPKILSFWMSNTWIPLSIAFIEEDGTVINIEEMKPLLESRRYVSDKACRIAVEMNKGWFTAHEIEPGDRISLGSEILGLEAR